MTPTTIIEIVAVVAAVVVGLLGGKLLGKRNAPSKRDSGDKSRDEQRVRDLNRKLKLLEIEGDIMKRRDQR